MQNPLDSGFFRDLWPSGSGNLFVRWDIITKIALINKHWKILIVFIFYAILHPRFSICRGKCFLDYNWAVYWVAKLTLAVKTSNNKYRSTLTLLSQIRSISRSSLRLFWLRIFAKIRNSSNLKVFRHYSTALGEIWVQF